MRCRTLPDVAGTLPGTLPVIAGHCRSLPMAIAGDLVYCVTLDSDVILGWPSIRTAIWPAASGVGGWITVDGGPETAAGVSSDGEARDLDPGAGGARRGARAEGVPGRLEALVFSEREEPDGGVVLPLPYHPRTSSQG